MRKERHDGCPGGARGGDRHPEHRDSRQADVGRIGGWPRVEQVTRRSWVTWSYFGASCGRSGRQAGGDKGLGMVNTWKTDCTQSFPQSVWKDRSVAAGEGVAEKEDWEVGGCLRMMGTCPMGC